MTNNKNTNATIDGEFEAFKVAMGVKPNLTPAPKAWIQSNWKTIERLAMDENCVLSHKEYRDVFQRGNWKKCFGNFDLWNAFIQDQNDKGAWVNENPNETLEIFKRGVAKALEIHPFGLPNTKWDIERIRMAEGGDGYSMNGWSFGYDTNICFDWKKTSRKTSNVVGVADQMCEILEKATFKTSPTEEWIMMHYKKVVGGVGWRPNGGAYWSRDYQYAQLKVENEHRAIVRKFLETKDYGVFGTYEHEVWNSEKHAYETVVDDVGQIMRAKIERAIKAKKIVLAA